MNLILPRRRSNQRMINVIKRLGLTSGLQLCLDAGDIDSYDGSSQTWVDQSGGGYSVYRGSGSGSDAADPTFNGVAGRQSASEYWTFDGTADLFTLNQANPSWVNNLHKNNAKWAFASWLYVGASLPASASCFFGTNGSGNTQIGVSAFVRSTGALRITVTNGTSTVLLLTSSATVNLNAWNYLAAEIQEAAGTGSLTVNAAQQDFTSTYTSPSASAADLGFEVGHDGVGFGTGYIPSGYRLANLQIWEGTIPTKAQLLDLRTLTASKFA